MKYFTIASLPPFGDYYTKYCPFCGIKFYDTHQDPIYCDPKCKSKYNLAFYWQHQPSSLEQYIPLESSWVNYAIATINKHINPTRQLTEEDIWNIGDHQMTAIVSKLNYPKLELLNHEHQRNLFFILLQKYDPINDQIHQRRIQTVDSYYKDKLISRKIAST